MDTVRHSTRRLAVELPGSFADVTGSFESAVPALDVAALESYAAERTWADVVAWTARRAPHGFLRYWRNDVRGLMRRAGDDAAAIAYLMGNHVTAERMFRFDPRVMNYAPLRVELSQVEGESVVFTVDVPSDHFGSFGPPQITAVGRELDAKLADLLVLLGATAAQVGELRTDQTGRDHGTSAALDPRAGHGG